MRPLCLKNTARGQRCSRWWLLPSLSPLGGVPRPCGGVSFLLNEKKHNHWDINFYKSACWQILYKLLLSTVTGSSQPALPKAFGWREKAGQGCVGDLINLSLSLGLLWAPLAWQALGKCRYHAESWGSFQTASESTKTSDKPWHCSGLSEVLWVHIKQEPPVFDTFPLPSGLKATCDSVTVDGTAFGHSSSWPPSKVLLLLITSLCYYWYLMLLFLHSGHLSDLCHDTGPYSIRCCRTAWEKERQHLSPKLKV